MDIEIDVDTDLDVAYVAFCGLPGTTSEHCHGHLELLSHGYGGSFSATLKL